MSDNPRPTRFRSGDLVLLLLVGALAALTVVLARAAWAGKADNPTWRLAIRPAAVVSGERVTLGEIAEPTGPVPDKVWRELAEVELFEAPERPGRPMVVAESKLRDALAYYLDEKARLCVVSNSLALQRGGAVMHEAELVNLVVKTLTKQAANLGGDAELRDFRIPDHIFLADTANTLEVELASGGIDPGRVSIYFRELQADGSLRRRISGSVFLDVWTEVAAAARPINRREALGPQMVTHVRKNLAYLSGDVWDGTGGPWQVKRPIGRDQVIYRSNLEPLPLVRRGETVRLVYEGENIRLETLAEALEDGGAGQAIAVMNLDSEREITATVRDSGTVYVQ